MGDMTIEELARNAIKIFEEFGDGDFLEIFDYDYLDQNDYSVSTFIYELCKIVLGKE